MSRWTRGGSGGGAIQFHGASNANAATVLAAIDPAWNGAVPYHAVFRPDGSRSAGLVGARPLSEIELALLSALPGTPPSATPATPPSLPPP